MLRDSLPESRLAGYSREEIQVRLEMAKSLLSTCDTYLCTFLVLLPPNKSKAFFKIYSVSCIDSLISKKILFILSIVEMIKGV